MSRRPAQDDRDAPAICNNHILWLLRVNHSGMPQVGLGSYGCSLMSVPGSDVKRRHTLWTTLRLPQVGLGSYECSLITVRLLPWAGSTVARKRDFCGWTTLGLPQVGLGSYGCSLVVTIRLPQWAGSTVAKKRDRFGTPGSGFFWLPSGSGPRPGSWDIVIRRIIDMLRIQCRHRRLCSSWKCRKLLRAVCITVLGLSLNTNYKRYFSNVTYLRR